MKKLYNLQSEVRMRPLAPVTIELPDLQLGQGRLVGGAIGGHAPCNGWNEMNGTESNVVSICLMCLIPFHYFHSSLYNEPILL